METDVRFDPDYFVLILHAQKQIYLPPVLTQKTQSFSHNLRVQCIVRFSRVQVLGIGSINCNYFPCRKTGKYWQQSSYALWNRMTQIETTFMTSQLFSATTCIINVCLLWLLSLPLVDIGDFSNNLTLFLLVFSHWASFSRNQSPVR